MIPTLPVTTRAYDLVRAETQHLPDRNGLAEEAGLRTHSSSSTQQDQGPIKWSASVCGFSPADERQSEVETKDKEVKERKGEKRRAQKQSIQKTEKRAKRALLSSVS